MRKKEVLWSTNLGEGAAVEGIHKERRGTVYESPPGQEKPGKRPVVQHGKTRLHSHPTEESVEK